MKDAPISPSARDKTEPAVPLDSAVLARLMEEVRNNVDHQPAAYNRMHNRHNR